MPDNFIWKPELSVDVKIIDEQHKRFIELLDMLYKSIMEMTERNYVSKVVEELLMYVDYHFATEEKYFEEFQYEFASQHKLEHEGFKKKIYDIRARVLNGDEGMSYELIDILEDWLVYHISNSDKKYVDCFHKHGLN